MPRRPGFSVQLGKWPGIRSNYNYDPGAFSKNSFLRFTLIDLSTPGGTEYQGEGNIPVMLTLTGIKTKVYTLVRENVHNAHPQIFVVRQEGGAVNACQRRGLQQTYFMNSRNKVRRLGTLVGGHPMQEDKDSIL